MLCERGEWPPIVPEDWLKETKLDGTRTLAEKRGQQIRLINRREYNTAEQYPEIVADLLKIPHDFVIDGEIMSKDFSTLAQRAHTTSKFKINLLAKVNPCRLMAFDILELGGRALLNLPLIERKKILLSSFSESEHLKIVKPMPLKTLVEMVEKHEIEGIVAKNPMSTYQFRRSHDWLKFRIEDTEDLPIIGYEDTDKPHRPFRSLILLRDGKEVQASSGLSEADLHRLDEIFKGKPQRQVGTKRYFEKPIGVAEIKFFGNSPDIPYRFPRVVRFREDKEV